MSGARADHDRILQHLVDEEAAALRDFISLLEREQDVLVRGDAEHLLPLAAEKNECFARLATLGGRRNQALAQAGFAADRAGIESWLAGRSDLLAARRRWQELLERLGHARDLNRTNGTLIATRLQHNQQALQALLSAANQASLYGPDGQARPAGGGRHLGSV